MLCCSVLKPGFLPGIFSGGKPIVMQISFVMLIFLLFSDQISGGRQKSLRGANCLSREPYLLWKKSLRSSVWQFENSITS